MSGSFLVILQNMRRLVLFLSVMVSLVANAWAYDFYAVAPSGQLLYYEVVGSSAVVTYPHQNMNDYWYNTLWPSGEVEIPAVVTNSADGQSYEVVSIGYCAFSGCREMTKVILPSSVRTIANCAFRNCTRLQEVTIPNSTRSIGDHAFSGCTSLKEVSIPNSVTWIDQYAFDCCSSLTQVVLPNRSAFVGNYAFADCQGLKCVRVPDSVRTIGENAFQYVTAVEYCGDAEGSPWGARWAGCLYEEGDFVFADESKRCLLSYFGSDSVVSVPDMVTTIGDWAFREGDSTRAIVRVDLPDCLMEIGVQAFCNCKELKNLSLPEGVSSIGNSAFWWCRGLVEIESKSSEAPLLGNNVFYGVDAGIMVRIPCGSSDSYATGWPGFENYVEEYPYELTAKAEDESMGRVDIVVEPACANDGQAVVRAESYAGYRFVEWDDGDTENPRTLSIVEDKTMMAHFEVGSAVEIEGADASWVGSRDGGIAVFGVDGLVVVTDAYGHVMVRERVVGEQYWEMPKSGLYVVKVEDRTAQKALVVK